MGSVLSKNKKARTGAEKAASSIPSSNGTSSKIASDDTVILQKDLKDVKFGHEMRKLFPFEDKWTNLNHGKHLTDTFLVMLVINLTIYSASWADSHLPFRLLWVRPVFYPQASSSSLAPIRTPSR